MAERGQRKLEVVYTCNRGVLSTGIGVPFDSKPTREQVALAKAMVIDCEKSRDGVGIPAKPIGPCPPYCGLRQLSES